MVTIGFVLQSMYDSFVSILKAPFVDLSALWLLVPIALLWLVLEIYFDLYKTEELGWNTALGNGISLSWISISLMRYIFSGSGDYFSWSKFFAVFFILLYALFVAVVSFSHKFSKKVTFIVAAPSPIYFLSGVAVLWSYDALQISWWVVLDLFILFWVIVGIFAFIRKYLPGKETVQPERI